MASKIKVDQIQTADGSGTIALQNQLSGMTSASMPTGAILQTVKFASTNNQVESTSSSFAASGEEITITPSSTSSKILVIASWGAKVWNNSGSEGEGEYKIVGTANGDLMKHRYQAYDYGGSGMQQTTTQNMIVLDSPNSTSAQTYAIHMRLIAGGGIRTASDNMKTQMIAIEFK
jgi:hypothetical protein